MANGITTTTAKENSHVLTSMKEAFASVLPKVTLISGCYKPPQHHETQDVEIYETVYAAIDVA